MCSSPANEKRENEMIYRVTVGEKKELICVVAGMFDLRGLLLNLNKRLQSFQTAAAPRRMCEGVWTWRRQLSVILVISEHKRTVWRKITLLSALESVVSYVCCFKVISKLSSKTFCLTNKSEKKKVWLLTGSFQLVSSGLGHIWLFHTWLTAWSGFKCWADNCALWRVCREAVSQIIFMSKRAEWTRAEEKLCGIKSISASAASQFWAITIIPYSVFLAYWMVLSLPERQPGLCSCFWQHVSNVGCAIPFSHKSLKEGLKSYKTIAKMVFYENNNYFLIIINSHFHVDYKITNHWYIWGGDLKSSLLAKSLSSRSIRLFSSF